MEGKEAIPGGSALNSIRGANFMLKDTLPNSTAFFGCIGKDDQFGQTLEKELNGAGVKSYLH